LASIGFCSRSDWPFDDNFEGVRWIEQVPLTAEVYGKDPERQCEPASAIEVGPL
jgi:hypothetical protein